MTDKTFTKYKLVVDEWFINGFNGSKAYNKYYPKSTRPDDSFSKIQRIPEVQKYISERQNEISESNKITIDECVSILTKMVRFDIKDIYDENGVLKSIHDIPEDTRIAIESLETDEIFSEKMVIGYSKKIKTSSRRANAVELLKYLGAFEKHNEQKGLRIPKRVEVIIKDYSKPNEV